MRQDQLKPPVGAKHSKKRIGRGDGSQGTTAGKGTKGQKARAGGGVRPGFEGGQLPIIKRLPSIRGFTNVFKIEYSVVNVGDLERFDAQTEVTKAVLKNAGLIRHSALPVKMLGDGNLSKALKVQAVRFSESAKAKIEAAGGTAEVVASRA